MSSFIHTKCKNLNGSLALRKSFRLKFFRLVVVLSENCWNKNCFYFSQGVQYSTFVLTDIDSKFRYGFCRYLPRASHCLCILRYIS